MNEPEFLEVDAVLFLHDCALREYGGAQGIKSADLLHSALDRPLNRYHYADPVPVDLFDIAAAYAFGIAGNHPFNDANKRTGWACCVLFLKANGQNVAITAPDVVERMVALVERKIDETEFAIWLRKHQLP
ncbi:type II toxin-antitoxin system death-on-curing family toxin [Komagataeibacter xylinus]|uniref:Type II toxin-antitoxin system death-on-curing family toxin n=3 Tax=Komagataeibacter TaxID=1434011 RepID=A0A181C698_9PROT|nr:MULTISPECIES: type II toxin-antitoxin system death-on-curing family toxin [Komagataeibacter]EGG74501.1 Death on curing protein [Gluconacetobacter sp. SXCC-1]NVN38833.1 type II toxin-antitoxin system death-on-curing family toxin [Komagataeibacter swingsii]PYD55378.1 type II toxin-antitoxin system death-on-curing family toxin [Komagataeibacter xylinus]QIP36816.1 type II toxin-antitoxin system death-on-curing family toxin [Komagataeibacter rhaeticus]QIP37233.1 type II toxin-antitoxin system de